jgi:hypothetical protein
MDLATLDIGPKQEEGVDVPIRHFKTGEPIGLTIRVAGYDSERVKKARRREADEAVDDRRRKFKAAQAEESGLNIIAATVVSWRFDKDVTIDGKQPACTPEEVKRLFRRFPWMAEQCEAVAGDRAAFLPS